jgi:4-aminobutyrate aminotransferase-like enzyme
MPVRFVRGIGLLAVVELDLAPSLWPALAAELRARKVLVHLYPKRGSVIFSPPLCIDEKTLRRGVELFAEASVAAQAASQAQAAADSRSPS